MRLSGVDEAGLPRRRRAREQVADLHAHQRGGTDAERRECAVAPADVRVAEERVPEAVSLRELEKRRARIGYRDIMAPLAQARPEILEQRARLDRAPRLGGDDEQRASQLERDLEGADRGGVGRVEHVQPGPSGAGGKAATQHLRGERGAAHAEQHDVGDALVANLLRERLGIAQFAEHPLRDRQPAQPVGDLGGARLPPQGGVTRANALLHPQLLGERQLALHDRAQRIRYPRFDGQGVVAHATIVVAAALV